MVVGLRHVMYSRESSYNCMCLSVSKLLEVLEGDVPGRDLDELGIHSHSHFCQTALGIERIRRC